MQVQSTEHASIALSCGVVSQADDATARPRRIHLRTLNTRTTGSQSESRYETRSFS